MKHIQTVHRGEPQPFADTLRSATGLSDKEIRLLIKMGGAYLGRRRCKQPGLLVRSGDQVAAFYRLPLEMKPVTFDPSWILTDNGGFLVADKPAGLPTQGRRDADYMAFYEILKKNVRGYLGLHHRLDQDTSGLMLFARNRAWNKDIARAFSERKITKLYLVVASGSWPAKERQMTIDRPIATTAGPHGVRHHVSTAGKEARTEVFKLADEDGLVLVAAKPVTGRTHQIRIHLSNAGMPLAGDLFYGGPALDQSSQTNRFLLHCRYLAWPEIGLLKRASFSGPVPAVWREILPKGLSRALDNPDLTELASGLLPC